MLNQLRYALLILSIWACLASTAKGKAMNKVSTHENESCRLDVELLDISAQGAKLRYTFTNQGRSNFYLFNRLYTHIEGKKFITVINNVYIEIGRETAVISKKIFPVPDDLDVERTNVPCASLIKPGASTTETIELRFPLIPTNPYKTTKNFSDLPQKVALWFEVGGSSIPPEGERMATMVDTKDGMAYYFSSFPANKQLLLRAGPLPIKVPARLPK